jgi:hypothetical protein
MNTVMSWQPVVVSKPRTGRNALPSNCCVPGSRAGSAITDAAAGFAGGTATMAILLCPLVAPVSARQSGPRLPADKAYEDT